MGCTSTKKENSVGKILYQKTNVQSDNITNIIDPHTIIVLSFILEKADPKFSYQIHAVLTENTVESNLGSTDKQSGEKIEFDTTFKMRYFFEKEQNLTLTLSIDGEKQEHTVTIGRVMGSKNFLHSIIIDEDLETTLFIKASESFEDNKFLNILMSVTSPLRSNAAILISRPKSNGSHAPIYRTEVRKLSNNQIAYEMAKIPFSLFMEEHITLSNLHIAIVEGKSGKVLDESDIYFSQLTMQSSVKLPLGSVIQINGNVEKKTSFVDYLKGGMQISLTIGIDFTYSNEVPSNPASLHFSKNGSPTLYSLAISKCGSIVAPYDRSGEFTVLGFGAILPGTNTTSHCFPVSLAGEKIAGITNVIQSYGEVLKVVKFNGPTNFTPIIRKVLDKIRGQNLRFGYHILMMLTDGAITDMVETIDALVEASFLPISVIIIGIGYGDFGNMEILDADENPLVSRRGVKARRDLVQFVPFNKFQNNSELLAKEVLMEIPRQVVEFYQQNNIEPGE